MASAYSVDPQWLYNETWKSISQQGNFANRQINKQQKQIYE